MSLTEKSSQKPAPEVEEGFDLIKVITLIWLQRVVVARIVILTTLIGLIFAFISQKSFGVKTIMVPTTGQSAGVGGNLGGLASLAGINLGGVSTQGNEIPPKLYPQIVNSLPFQLDLLETKIFLDYDSSNAISYQEYQLLKNSKNALRTMRDFSLGLPSKLIGLIRGTDGEIEKDYDFISLTEDQEEVIENLKDQIQVSVDERNGIITLQVNMPDAHVAAIMAQRALFVLQRKVTEFKILKAQEELDFTRALYEEKKVEFETAQTELSRYRDANQNINTYSGRNELDKLESEFNLTLDVYTEIAKQLESAKIKIKEDTPSFSIIQPVLLPNEPVKPRKAMTILVSIFFGLLLGAVFVYLRDWLSHIKIGWNG